jgi:hypothetical protein
MSRLEESIYGVKPAGHAALPATPCEPARDDLLERCISWMGTLTGVDLAGPYQANSMLVERQYCEAADLVRGLSISIGEANGLLMDSRVVNNSRYGSAGLFLSALYNTCMAEPVVTYDLDTPTLRYVGYKFPRILVNTGVVRNLGTLSTGIIINEHTASGIGSCAQGILINKGNTYQIGDDSQAIGINIGFSQTMDNHIDLNVGELQYGYWRDKQAFDFKAPTHATDPGLEVYVRNLSSCPPGSIMDRYGDVATIKEQIGRMFHV